MTLFAVIEHTRDGGCDSCSSCQASFFGVFTTREKAQSIAEQNSLHPSAVVEVVVDVPVRDVAIY